MEQFDFKKMLNAISYGGWIGGILTIVSMLQEFSIPILASNLLFPIIGLVAVAIGSFVYNYFFTPKFNFVNFLYPLIGVLTVFIAVGFGIWFNHLTLSV